MVVPFVLALSGLGLMPLREVFTGKKLSPKNLVKSSTTTTKITLYCEGKLQITSNDKLVNLEKCFKTEYWSFFNEISKTEATLKNSHNKPLCYLLDNITT